MRTSRSGGRKASEASELRTLSKRVAGGTKNPVFFGQRMSQSQARKYARAHDLPYAPWMITPAERRKQQQKYKREKARRRAEMKALREQQKKRQAKVIEMPKRNPSRKQRSRRKKAKAFLTRQVRKLLRENPVPALLTSLGSAIEQGAGLAVGSAVGSHAIRDIDGSGRKPVKKPKSKPRRGGKSRGGKKHPAKRKIKKAKKNSPRRRVKRAKRITHAIAVGRVRGRVGGRDRRIVFTGTKREVHEQARLMRRAGAKSIHVGHVG